MKLNEEIFYFRQQQASIKKVISKSIFYSILLAETKVIFDFDYLITLSQK